MDWLRIVGLGVLTLFLACPTARFPTDGGVDAGTGGQGPSGGGFNPGGGGQANGGGFGGAGGGQNVGGGFATGGGGGGGECTGYPPPAGGGAIGCISRPVIRPYVVFEGVRLDVDLRAPIPECRPIALSVSVDVTAPDASTVTPSFTSFATVDQWGGVTTRVRFVPPSAGTYRVHAAFEPSLGEATLDTPVTAVFAEHGEIVTTVGCLDAPWPVDAETLACETAGGQISLFSVDGGTTAFDGINLVVVEDVLWSLRDAGTSFSLERHRWSDGGVWLTNQWGPDFSSARLRSEHTKDVAIRLRTPLAGHDFIRVALAEDGGMEEVFAADTDALWSYSGGALHADSMDGSVAFADGARWAIAPPLMFACEQVNLISETKGGLLGAPHLTPGPSTEFERWPVWLDYATHTVVFTSSGGFVDLPLSRVVRVGSKYSVLTAQGGYLIAPTP
ncbi:MAG: hypothetical protein QM817_01670 [Archangium sp.]